MTSEPNGKVSDQDAKYSHRLIKVWMAQLDNTSTREKKHEEDIFVSKI